MSGGGGADGGFSFENGCAGRTKAPQSPGSSAMFSPKMDVQGIPTGFFSPFLRKFHFLN
ncbi:MAG: hypothetical protein H3C46_04480 [Ignavibacteria bacterium]|nr:hypothetical protein [Ignavibacteria bacterium]MBZ0197764.1 hypothetical protein [Ignavibacteriaceae bacterium]